MLGNNWALSNAVIKKPDEPNEFLIKIVILNKYIPKIIGKQGTLIKEIQY